jgi:chaperonin GroEL
MRSLKTAARGYSTRTGKDILFGDEARLSILSGVQRISRAVSVTLGPKGRNVLVEQPFGAPKITKDGVTVAQAVEFADHQKNLGAQLIREVASNANTEAGDGTTTATLLAHSIYSEGCRSVRRGVSATEVKKGIDFAVQRVVGHLHEQTRSISTKEEITQVATISANGDTAIGNLIGEAMEKVGKDGVITTAEGKTAHTDLELTEGMQLDRGFISPYFVTQSKEQLVQFEDAFVLLSRNALSNFSQIIPVLEYVTNNGNRPLLIFADDVDGEALSALILNKIQGRLKVCATKTPGFGDNKVAILHDIAALTGGQVVDDEAGVSLAKFDPSMLGTAKKVTVNKDTTTLLGGGGSTEAVQERLDVIQSQIILTDSSYDKEKMAERMAKLAGSVAVIRVGGISDVEVGEKQDRFEDALNATRAAVSEGIVAGGGMALMYASNVLREYLQDPKLSTDMKTGVRIVMQAIRQPCQQIVENAGLEGAVVMDTLIKQSDYALGYDSSCNAYVNMFETGIIDPTKVVRTALVDAASIAALMITTEATVVDAVEEKEKDEVMLGGGRDGRGGIGEI